MFMDEYGLAEKYRYSKITSLEEMPINQDNSDRFTQLRRGLVAHATTEESLPNILSEGLKPRQEHYCRVWDDDRIPSRIEKEGRVSEILGCRNEHVYFWDDVREVAGQGLASVGYLKEGNPAIVIAELNQKSLLPDPEIDNCEEEPQAFMHKGKISHKKNVCFCVLDKDVKPDVGRLMCSAMHNKDECELSTEDLWETLSEPSNWVCFCKKDKI